MWRRRRERLLFRTYRAQFQAREWAPGEVVCLQGELFRVTRWEELPPGHLPRGGAVHEWEIWGRRLSEREVAEEAENAAERILAEGDSAGGKRAH